MSDHWAIDAIRERADHRSVSDANEDCHALLAEVDRLNAELKLWKPQPQYCQRCKVRVISSSEHLKMGPRWTCMEGK